MFFYPLKFNISALTQKISFIIEFKKTSLSLVRLGSGGQ